MYKINPNENILVSVQISSPTSDKTVQGPFPYLLSLCCRPDCQRESMNTNPDGCGSISELSFVDAPERKTRSQLEGGPHKDPITSKSESHSISPSDVPSTPKENVIKGKWKPRKCKLACRFPGLEMKGKPQPTERKIACRFPGQEMKGKPQTNMWALTFRFLGLHA